MLAIAIVFTFWAFCHGLMIQDDLKYRNRSREVSGLYYISHDEKFIKQLTQDLEIEADGGDDPSEFVRWALEKQWRERA